MGQGHTAYAVHGSKLTAVAAQTRCSFATCPTHAACVCRCTYDCGSSFCRAYSFGSSVAAKLLIVQNKPNICF